jgi:hypothetical protein
MLQVFGNVHSGICSGWLLFHCCAAQLVNLASATVKLQVSAIDTCAREPQGRLKCAQVQGELGEAPSSGPFGKALFGQ